MPTLDAQALDFISRSPGQTRQIGARLGVVLRAGDVICLQGELGAGKTTFVQGIAQGWGSLDSVSSPTFLLVNEYRRPDHNQLFHMDAYRLDSVLEAELLDLNSMLDNGALVLEWPERLEVLIPAERLWVNLQHMGAEQRSLKFTAVGKRYEEILDVIRRAGGQ